jgi:PleD family two-component response regulator
VAEHRFPQIGPVTVSIGYTRVSPDDIPASAVERADTALYYAKEHGRNCSHCYEALLRTGAVVPKVAGTTELELF